MMPPAALRAAVNCKGGPRMTSRRPTGCTGVTRRSFLADTGMGFTGLALGAMLFRDGALANPHASPSREGGESAPHAPPKAKSGIWIFLCGGVSHVESVDVTTELDT